MGSFATVWHAYDPELDVPVAIKVLAENWAHNVDVRERFLAEARLLRRVRDQRIVRVHDIGTLPDNRPYFVMDFADSGTLADLIEGRPPPGEALRLGAEVARAVQVLHDHGVAHRDVKPGNLLLTSLVGRSDLGVVVADLGMAKSLAEASGFTLTAGTPAYMAPEQALGLGFDQRADVYAIAAVTYALLAGHQPYEGKGLTGVAERARSGPPEPLNLDMEGALDTALAQALSGDPEDRPRSASDFALQLDALADGGDMTVLRVPVAPDDIDTELVDEQPTLPEDDTAQEDTEQDDAPQDDTPPDDTEDTRPVVRARSAAKVAEPTGPQPATVALAGLVIAALFTLVTWILMSVLPGVGG